MGGNKYSLSDFLNVLDCAGAAWLTSAAYRTHRERKEMYIKALEDEVVRLKQVYTGSSQDKKKVAEENRRLKALVQQHGIPPPEATGGDTASSSRHGSRSGTQQMNYEQTGIDFMLT